MNFPVALSARECQFSAMGGKVVVAALALLAAAFEAHAAAPIYDPVVLNIGVNCQWQQRCIGKQRRAMKDARDYIAKTNPPLWRIHLCNRNAARSRDRIDWVGFNNCIRNAALPPLPPQRHSGRRHH
jgi:hypothetical protein